MYEKVSLGETKWKNKCCKMLRNKVGGVVRKKRKKWVAIILLIFYF
jgi:hypothetical protein